MNRWRDTGWSERTNTSGGALGMKKPREFATERHHDDVDAESLFRQLQHTRDGRLVVEIELVAKPLRDDDRFVDLLSLAVAPDREREVSGSHETHRGTSVRSAPRCLPVRR